VSDTFFTAAPHWQWLIILYFFIGGIAGGSFFIGALLDLFAGPRDQPVARLGYYVAFVGAVLSGILLTVDLDRPERFWHMLIQSERGGLMFKYWSPMSVGAWGLLIFGAFATLAALKALAEEGRVRWTLLRRLRGGVTRVMIAVLGGLAGFFLAGYTGVLLSVTNRPIWADTNLVGLLFLLSGASTAAAALVLFSLWRGTETEDVVHWLSQFDSAILVVELLALIALVVSLGSVARVWLNVWGILLLVGVVLAGILLPLTLHWRPRLLGDLNVPTAAALVLVGGFLLRVVIILSSEGI
jgi:formate-dependent nitrite reductase membrane component NrfD